MVRSEVSLSEANCKHCKSFVGSSHFSKILRNITIIKCQWCPITQPLFMCLSCTKLGCVEEHGESHYKASRKHPLAINTINFKIWCFDCCIYVKDPNLQSFIAATQQLIHLYKQNSLIDNEKIIVKNCTIEKDNENNEGKDGVTNEIVEKPNNKKKKKAIDKNCKEKISTETSNIEAIKVENNKKLSPLFVKSEMRKCKGLTNLGNTCFFNAVLQCIMHMSLFERQLRFKDGRTVVLEGFKTFEHNEEDDDKDEEFDDGVMTIKEQLENVDGVTKALLDVIESTKEASTSTITPSDLLSKVCKSKHYHLSHGEQHDSHELLRCLLNAVNEEETKRLKRTVLKCLGVKGSSNSLSDKKKKQIKMFGGSANHGSVSEVFGGVFVNSITCTACCGVQQNFESFLDISLPICTTANQKGGLSERSSSSRNRVSKHQLKKAQKKEKLNKKRLKKSHNRNERGDSCEEDVVKEVSALKIDENANKNDREEEDNVKNENKSVDGSGNKTGLDGISDEFDIENVNINGKNSEDTNDSETQVVNDEDLLKDENSNCKSSHIKDKLKMNSSEKSEVEEKVNKDEVMKYAMVSLQKQQKQSSCTLQNNDTANENKQKQSLVNAEENVEDQTSLSHFLELYSAPEILSDAYLCPNCNTNHTKVKTTAVKQVLIQQPPAILTIHLKRFKQMTSKLEKVSKKISFGEYLDLSPYCSSLLQDEKTSLIYRLKGLVEHQGSLSGGHYTACVRVSQHNPPPSTHVSSFGDCQSPCANSAQKHEDASLFNHHQTSFVNSYLPEKLRFNSMVKKYSRLKNSENSSEKLSNVANNITTGSSFLTRDNHDTIDNDVWYLADDSRISKLSGVEAVLRKQAYILFYERI